MARERNTSIDAVRSPAAEARPLASQAMAAASAREAGLRYVADDRPGMRRIRHGASFSYVGVDGKAVRDADTLTRIRALVIPPAWTDVWICPLANGHLQATGRDARGRKQYRYHARWRAVRDENKFGRLAAFARALPAIRRRVGADLGLPGLPREKVLATVVRLLETTFIRVGNERYARENGSFGLTTMRTRHVQVKGERIAFSFRGKSGKQHHIEVEDARLARIVRRCRDLPGYDLFQYVDEAGQTHSIGSADVNDYLREIGGEDYTAKDFRTWAGTLLTVLALRTAAAPSSEPQAKKLVNAAVGAVAHYLGNTVAVCRKCYIHPRVIDAFLEGVGANAGASAFTRPALLRARRGRALEGAVIALLVSRASRSRKATPQAALAKTLRRSLAPPRRPQRTRAAALT